MAVLIWSGSVVALRFGMVTTLNAYDLTALRFGTAAPLLLVVVAKNMKPIKELGVARLLVLILSFGAPYVVLLSVAVKTIPASSAGALNPAAMAVFSSIFGIVYLKNRVRTGLLIGSTILLFGIWLKTTLDPEGFASGHFIAIVTGWMWAVYALTLKGTGTAALTATALVSVGSAILFLPIYLFALPKGITSASGYNIVTQMVIQGVFVSLIAVYAFSRSTEILGFTVAGTLPALIPLVSLILGYIFLGEAAGGEELIVALVVGIGVTVLLARASQERS